MFSNILTDWINKLDEIYNAILKELDIMQEILEKSQRRSEEHVHTKRRQKEKQPHNDVTTPLDKWL
jgi:hypothetical protein